MKLKLTQLKTWLSSRARKEPVTTIVLHGTGGRLVSGSISWLDQIGLSYHYIIDRDGSVTKLVPLSRVAFHAGVSSGPGGKDVNRYSIGIAFANRENGVEQITPEQIEAARVLVKQLAESDRNIKWLTRHLDIAPKRKTDPIMLSRSGLKLIAAYAGLSAWIGGVL